MTNTRSLTPFVRVIVALTAADLATKRWATSALSDGPHELPGPVDLQLSYNTGTAFGLFSNLPAIIISIATVVLIAVVVNMWRTNNAPVAPVALIVAGGLANLLDRFEGGGVVDMLHTGWWPTFNLADIYITVGVAWWIATSLSSTGNANQQQLAQNRTPEQLRQ